MSYEIVHTFVYDDEQIAQLQARMMNELVKPNRLYLSESKPLFIVREIEDATTKETSQTNSNM